VNDFSFNSDYDLWPLFERSFDGVLIVAPAPLQVAAANLAAAKCIGAGVPSIVGRRLVELFDDETRANALEQVQRAWVGDSSEPSIFATLITDAGGLCRVELRASAIVLKGERRVGVVFRQMAGDGGEASHSSQRVDPLTGLHDRDFFLQRMELLLRNAKGAGDDFAVLFVDLDNFKAVNDRFGHLVGDRVLREAARRLAKCVGPTNCLVRYGGDEFVVLIEGVESRAAAETLAIRDAIAPPIALAEGDVSLSVSVGIATGSPDYRTPEDVLAAADRAMYAAKRK
jgi:diguanylate cyclase (GGDEF)-like protein